MNLELVINYIIATCISATRINVFKTARNLGPIFLPELRLSFAINFASLMIVSCLSENPRLTWPSKSKLSISSYRFAQNQFWKRRLLSNFLFLFIYIFFNFLYPLRFFLRFRSRQSRESRGLENNTLDFAVYDRFSSRCACKRSDPRPEVESARRARFRLQSFQDPRVRLYPV